jgi:two-component system response regulator HydG
MHLANQLSRQIDDPNLTRSERARLRCQLAKEFEDSGNYEAARGALGELWTHIGARPQLDELDQHTAAELLLRAGCLTGWIGSAQQIDGAQEKAKDFISESANLFSALQETEKVAEAYIDLALCYWREGSFDEARVSLREAISLVADADSEQKARAFLNSSVVEISLNRFNEALRILTTAAPLFEKSQSHAAKGRFYIQLALVLRKLGAAERREDYIDRSLVEYAAASYHFEQAGHTRYCARVENNIAFILFTQGRYGEAHEHLNHAERLFHSLKDRGSIAQVSETRARVFLAEEKTFEAEKTIREAVRTFEKGDESSLLAEALTTQGLVLARLERDTEARAALERAQDVACRVGDKESAGVAAITLLEELGERLRLEELTSLYERADQLLEGSKNIEALERLRACARQVLSAGTGTYVREAELPAPKFIYADERTSELLRAAHLIASTEGTVLITGETGTGKEVLARLIHEWSGRAGRFVTINCDTLNESLTESLLFGHRTGNFTEAIEDHTGAAREAAGGTLFLDEIAELSNANQGKLLRLIERGEVHAIGAPEPERVDVRVVAVANCDLQRRVAEGRFREDLLYRLNTFHLQIPPLRERTKDIPPIAAHLIAEAAELHRRRVTFSAEAIEAMRRLPLHGNARELRSLIEQLVLTSPNGALIKQSAIETHALMSAGNQALAEAAWDGCSLRQEVTDYESRLIKLALEASEGSVTHAARLLGITHQRLCSMLQARHKNLLPARKSAQPRKRSIISKFHR